MSVSEWKNVLCEYVMRWENTTCEYFSKSKNVLCECDVKLKIDQERFKNNSRMI